MNAASSTGVPRFIDYNVSRDSNTTGEKPDYSHGASWFFGIERCRVRCVIVASRAYPGYWTEVLWELVWV
jgi:hypothetical protein